MGANSDGNFAIKHYFSSFRIRVISKISNSLFNEKNFNLHKFITFLYEEIIILNKFLHTEAEYFASIFLFSLQI